MYIQTKPRSIRTFFSLVRVRFGSNNNPTPYQFESTYKRILLGISDKITSNTNVSLLESSNFVAYTPTVQERIDYVFNYYDFEDVNVENIVYGIACFTVLINFSFIFLISWKSLNSYISVVFPEIV